MRQSTILAAAFLATAVFMLSAPVVQATEPGFGADATLTYLGTFEGQQRYRFDYTLTNLGEPYGLTGFQVFFNADPVTQEPTGDHATFREYGSPEGWGDVTVYDKNTAGQWSVLWDYDWVTPGAEVVINESLSGFSVVFDWNDPATVPPIQHTQARNGGAYSEETDITEFVGLAGTIGGIVHADCFGVPQPAGGIAVNLLHNSAPYASTVTLADGTYLFADVPLGTYTVIVVPPSGYGTTVDNRLVTLEFVDQAVTADFFLTCRLANVEGTVTGACNGQGLPLQGVTVDLFSVDAEGHEVLVGTTASDAAGRFSFSAVALGDYLVSVVTPLGYVADANVKPLHLDTAGATYTTGFSLACQSITAEPRTIGYWKHQVSVYLSGRGHAQESLDNMLRYTDLLLVHFNGNIVNPVVVYVPGSSAPGDRLFKLQELLTVNRGGTMLDRAKQQLLALLLNVVSGKIAQTHVISPNGATVSQAITYANDLMVDGNPANDETAKTIADLINNGQGVPAGMVPSSTRIITYSRRPGVSGQNPALAFAPPFPNPSRGAVTFAFSLPRAGAVRLGIFDVNGRAVRTLVQGEHTAGSYQQAWDATDDGGRRVPPGIYYSRLVTPDGAMNRAIVVER